MGTRTLLFAAALVTALSSRASAATLTEVTDFGANPSALRMFVYVPDHLAPRPAVVVAAHACHGDGRGFHASTGFARLADRYGFVVVYPSVTQSADHCFDVASRAALRRNGGSDPVGVRSMVAYALRRYGADRARVFVVGVSSGAMLTNVLLGNYPDVFRAGVAFAGVPYGCFAGPTRWNADCANGRVTRSARRWGDLVRAAYRGYRGPRPRVQLWHGTDDAVLRYRNFAEAIGQWCDVLGVGPAPSATDHPRARWTHTRYGDASGVRVEAISLDGVPHDLPVDAEEAIHFFGLDLRSREATEPLNRLLE